MAVAPAIAAGVGSVEVVVLALDAALRSCWFARLRPIPRATAPLPLPPAASIRPRPRILTRHQARRGLPPLLARA